jgi:hypothetical protein
VCVCICFFQFFSLALWRKKKGIFIRCHHLLLAFFPSVRYKTLEAVRISRPFVTQNSP